MSRSWANINVKEEPLSLQEIMSEEFAKELQSKEYCKFAHSYAKDVNKCEIRRLPSEILNDIKDVTQEVSKFCDSDAIIAQMLQYQFDKEYDEELKRIENKKNGLSKVSVSYSNHRMVPEELLSSDSDDNEIDGYDNDNKNWDRFNDMEKEYSSMPRCGYKVHDGMYFFVSSLFIYS